MRNSPLFLFAGLIALSLSSAATAAELYRFSETWTTAARQHADCFCRAYKKHAARPEGSKDAPNGDPARIGVEINRECAAHQKRIDDWQSGAWDFPTMVQTTTSLDLTKNAEYYVRLNRSGLVDACKADPKNPIGAWNYFDYFAKALFYLKGRTIEDGDKKEIASRLHRKGYGSSADDYRWTGITGRGRIGKRNVRWYCLGVKDPKSPNGGWKLAYAFRERQVLRRRGPWIVLVHKADSSLSNAAWNVFMANCMHVYGWKTMLVLLER